MRTPVIGALFAGYGGLEHGVQAVLGGDVSWYSEIDKGALKILGHRYPDTPNVGDITTVDWTRVEPIDVLTGGFPCQDVSHAGKRGGLRPDTRTGLWSQMAYAIDQLRPALVVAENVRGLLSAEAHSDLEHCPWCMGDGTGVSALRALGAVLGDLADLGYDAAWHGLRAADVGAPHGRFRVFVVARPADAERERLEGAEPFGVGRAVGEQSVDDRGTTLLPTPTGQDGSNNGGPSQYGRHSPPLNVVAALLPTPAVNDMGAAYTPDEWDEWTDRMKAEHGNGNGHGKSLSIEAARLLQTPSVAPGTGGHETRGGARSDEPLLNGQAKAMHGSQWGDYAEAIARWEHTLGRPAPPPTMTSTKGNPQLSPAFVEWMMGLPAGWVTDTPHITRNEALKALGNGVVPQQAAAAVAFLLEHLAVAA